MALDVSSQSRWLVRKAKVNFGHRDRDAMTSTDGKAQLKTEQRGPRGHSIRWLAKMEEMYKQRETDEALWQEDRTVRALRVSNSLASRRDEL